MKTPTAIQLKFVQAIEDAVTDIIQQNIAVKKVHEVTDRAEFSVADLAAYVTRMRDAGHWMLIDRLAESFLKIGMAPGCITKALEVSPQSRAIPTAKSYMKAKAVNFDSQPLQLERSLPKALAIPKSLSVIPEVLAAEQEDQEIQTLTTVLKLLKRLPATERRRVADQAYRYAGMGE